MFDNIEKTIKGLAFFVLYVGVFGGAIWLVFSGYTLYDNREFLEYSSLISSRDASEYTIKAVAAKSSILYSIILIMSSLISSFILFGFGEIIDKLKSINSKLESKENIYIPNEKVQEE